MEVLSALYYKQKQILGSAHAAGVDLCGSQSTHRVSAIKDIPLRIWEGCWLWMKNASAWHKEKIKEKFRQ